MTTTAMPVRHRGGHPIICSDGLGIAASSPAHQTEDDILDTLVQQASQPTLADLFKRGIKTGALKPQAHYTN